jgi:hypothetical protein
VKSKNSELSEKKTIRGNVSEKEPLLLDLLIS